MHQMNDALKNMLDNGVLTEDAKSAINEAWEKQLNEARESVRVEIREEFANRYEHDKGVMVKALDKMVTETLKKEIVEFQHDKKALTEQRVKFATEMKSKGSNFDKFLTKRLAEEILEFRKDQKQVKESQNRLESFVFKQLAKEIKEFAVDKRAVVDTKVKLVSEAKAQLNSLKKAFVARSGKAVKEAVTSHLKKELSQLREDIDVAKRNSFGRKIFEAFASEFSTSQLNENAELRKLTDVVAKTNAKLAQAQKAVTEKQAVLESREKQIRKLAENQERGNVMNELLDSLNKEKRVVMSELLEGVKTNSLRSAFDKYLPSVLNSRQVQKASVLTESKKVVTGNKTAKANEDNIIDIKRLAGLN
jgi:hypothetical protein